MDPSAASRMVVETTDAGPNVRKREQNYLKHDEAEIDDAGNFKFGFDDDEDYRKEKNSDSESRSAGKRRKVMKRKKRRKQKGGGGGDDESSYALHLIKPGLLGRKVKAKKKARFKLMMTAPKQLSQGMKDRGQPMRGKKRKRSYNFN